MSTNISNILENYSLINEYLKAELDFRYKYINTLRTYLHNKDLHQLLRGLQSYHSSLHFRPMDSTFADFIPDELSSRFNSQPGGLPPGIASNPEDNNRFTPINFVKYQSSTGSSLHGHLDRNEFRTAFENPSNPRNLYGEQKLLLSLEQKVQFEILIQETRTFTSCNSCEGNTSLAYRKCQENPPCVKAGWFPYFLEVPITLVLDLIEMGPFVDRNAVIVNLHPVATVALHHDIGILLSTSGHSVAASDLSINLHPTPDAVTPSPPKECVPLIRRPGTRTKKSVPPKIRPLKKR